MKKNMIGVIITTALIVTGCTEDNININIEDTRPKETVRQNDEDTIIDDIKEVMPQEVKDKITRDAVIAIDSPWEEADPEEHGVKFDIDESIMCSFCNVKEDFSEGIYITPYNTPEGKMFCCTSETCKEELELYRTCPECGGQYTVVYPWEKCICKSCGYDPNEIEE